MIRNHRVATIRLDFCVPLPLLLLLLLFFLFFFVFVFVFCFVLFFSVFRRWRTKLMRGENGTKLKNLTFDLDLLLRQH